MFYQISKASQEKANVSELLNISESIREKASALLDNATFTDKDKLNELKQNTELLDLRVANNLVSFVSILVWFTIFCNNWIQLDDNKLIKIEEREE